MQNVIVKRENQSDVRLTNHKHFINRDSFCHAGDEAILDRVGNLKGSLEVQTSVVQEIIEEAELFKKRALIEKLSAHLGHLQERLSPNSDVIEVSKKKR